MQEEEEEEASESEEKEVAEPDPKPESAKRKQPQVRPWDIGKEGVKEGELLVLFFILAFSCCSINFLYTYIHIYFYIYFTYDLPSVIYNDYLCRIFINLFLVSFLCGMFSN